MSTADYPSIFPVLVLPKWAEEKGASILLVTPQTSSQLIAAESELDFLPRVVHDQRTKRQDRPEKLIELGYYDQLTGVVVSEIEKNSELALYRVKFSLVRYYSRDGAGLPVPGEEWEVFKFSLRTTQAAMGKNWALGKKLS